LSGWFVVSLRPVGQHAAIRRAARELGAAAISLPGMRLRACEDTATRDALAHALDCEQVIFSSPMAVRAAARLQALASARTRRILAIGRGTSAALHRHGISAVVTPDLETSEGLLALPGLQRIDGVSIGLVTAPGGRGLIASTLRARGADLRVAHVYARAPARLTRRHSDALLAATGSGAVLLSSAEALVNVLAGLPMPARQRLLACTVVASSARLAGIARDAGFARIVLADGVSPRASLAALAAHAKSQRIR
jgi:uroporphyrinogen-III synthase